MQSVKKYLIQHPRQPMSCLINSIPIIAVHNKDQPLSVLEVVPPKGPPQGTDLQALYTIN